MPVSDPLAIYLHDHLAGANFAIDLLESLRERYVKEQLGQMASSLLYEVEHDRQQLRQIIERVGQGSFDLKEAAAWLTEKVSRFKLGKDDEKGLATFQALETLALGKLALWRTLAVVAEVDDRLKGIDLTKLIARAEAQHMDVEQTRLIVARSAFSIS